MLFLQLLLSFFVLQLGSSWIWFISRPICQVIGWEDWRDPVLHQSSDWPWRSLKCTWLPHWRLPARGRLWSTDITITWTFSLYYTILQHHTWWMVVRCGWPTSVERLAQRSPQHRTSNWHFWEILQSLFSASWGCGACVIVWFLCAIYEGSYLLIYECRVGHCTLLYVTDGTRLLFVCWETYDSLIIHDRFSLVWSRHAGTLCGPGMQVHCVVQACSCVCGPGMQIHCVVQACSCVCGPGMQIHCVVQACSHVGCCSESLTTFVARSANDSGLCLTEMSTQSGSKTWTQFLTITNSWRFPMESVLLFLPTWVSQSGFSCLASPN